MNLKQTNDRLSQGGRRWRMAWLLCATLLGGCQGVHLYNAENDQTAAAAKAASDQLDLVGVIATERENKAALLNHELELVGDFATALRDVRLRALLEDNKLGDGTIEPLSTKQARFIKERLGELSGPGDPKDVANAATDLDTAAENLEVASQSFLNRLGVAPPACPIGPGQSFLVTDQMVEQVWTASEASSTGVRGRSRDDVRRVLDRHKPRCTKYQAAHQKLESLGGTVGASLSEMRDHQAKLEEERALAASAEAKYKTALKTYEDAVKQAGEDPSAEVRGKIEGAADAVRRALTSLRSLGGFGKRLAAGQEIDQLDVLLKAIAKGELDDSQLAGIDPEKKAAFAVAAQLPSLAERATRIASLAETPPVNALLLEKQRLLALKLDAETAVRRIETRLALLQRKREALLEEIDTLIDAQNLTAWAVEAHGNRRLTTADLINPAVDESARRLMVSAIATYLSTFTGPRKVVRETEYRQVDVDHAKALDSSETALRLWEAAVKQPVTVLAAYHGSGIKQEDIIELLKSAGLFTIGAGVTN